MPSTKSQTEIIATPNTVPMIEIGAKHPVTCVALPFCAPMLTMRGCE